MTPFDPPTQNTPPATAGGVLLPGDPPPRRALWQAVGPATLLAASITIMAGASLIALYRRYLLIEARDRVVGQAVPYGQALGAALAHRVAILQGFESFLKIQPDTRRDADALERYTADVQATTGGIRALQLVRGGRIVAIAPLRGNEDALGLDLRHHPDTLVRSKFAQSESTDAITITGPRRLAQGGAGLVLRNRFVRPGFPGHDIAALVLDLDPLLAEAGLVAPDGVRVALRDSSGALLYGSAELATESPVEVRVPVPDNVWRLEAVPARGWSAEIRERLFLFILGVLLSGVLFVVVVYLVATRHAVLMGAVEERTRSLRDAVEQLGQAAEEQVRTEDRLRQSQRLESLGRFAGGIAHDFNNLLTVILGSISLAREGIVPTSEAGTDLATAERAGHRASELTKKLLAFARRQAVEPQVVELNALLHELGSILRRLLGEQIALKEDLAPGLWRVFADPGQLEQMVTNLAVNARDVMPEGGTLTLSTRNIDLPPGARTTEPLAPGEYVRLEVLDTGSGMAPEVLQRVFEPFFTTKELGQGTGLGLATVYAIIRQAGGDVHLQSVVGRGTKATILLPRTHADAGSRIAQAPLEGLVAGGGESILLVEDEAPVRQVTTRILNEAKYRVMAAEDGESALRRLEPGQRIDLLIADVITPGMGGRALAERILERDPLTLVLFISGYTADERLEDLLARPGVAFLAKPFTARQLQRVVRQLLDTSRRG